jgi:uncharacterized OsmC-like protein
VTVERVESGRFKVTNARGGEITLGTGDDADLSPTELLLGAIGACGAIDVDTVTARRSEPDSFAVEVAATKVRDDDGNRLTDISVTFRVSFPAGPQGDEARAVLPTIVTRSHDRLCTVSRTVERGTPVTTKID